MIRRRRGPSIARAAGIAGVVIGLAGCLGGEPPPQETEGFTPGAYHCGDHPPPEPPGCR